MQADEGNSLDQHFPGSSKSNYIHEGTEEDGDESKLSLVGALDSLVPTFF